LAGASGSFLSTGSEGDFLICPSAKGSTERGKGQRQRGVEAVLLVLGYGKEENGPRPRPTRRKERGKGGEGGEGPGWADFGCGPKSCPRPLTLLNCFSFYSAAIFFFCFSFSFFFSFPISFLFSFLKYKIYFWYRKELDEEI
jgi:hypothetical protein